MSIKMTTLVVRRLPPKTTKLQISKTKETTKSEDTIHCYESTECHSDVDISAEEE